MSASPAPAASTDGSAPLLPPLLGRITRGEHLTSQEAEALFSRFMEGKASPVEIAAVLVGLKGKGLASAEVAGGVRALRRVMIPVAAEDPASLVDTAGTGGGRITTFNISTAAALVAAGAGVRVAKHGNRSFTSKCGSADVLEALGVRIDLDPAAMARVLAEVGIVFMFAPLLHPAMRHVGPVRKELGIPTVMNVLGPLTNPAGARRQVIGVSDPELLGLIVHALQQLDHEKALVVHGAPGMDELSPSGPTRVAELSLGQVREYEITPQALGLEPAPVQDLAGGSPEDNARLIRDLLAGERTGAPLTATLMNSGAAIYVSGRVQTVEEGVKAAALSISSGAALAKLESLREASHR